MPLSKQDYVSDIWKDGIFERKVLFCTGGAGTICSAQVRAMVHLGANACIVGRNVEKTESMAKDITTARKGSQVLGIGGVDVRSFESLQKAVERCVQQLGGIDYVIAGAAGNFLSPIPHLSPNAFKSVIDIDVLGSYNTLKATLPHLLKSASKNRQPTPRTSLSSPTPAPTSTSGRIIFISATIHYTTPPLQTHVSVAKAGVDVLSHSCAVEFGPRGLTSNVIAPGPIGGTEGMERLSRKEDVEAGMRNVPLGRWGTVKEIADATVFLFGDAGNFVSGQTLVVDGAAWRTSAGPGAEFKYPDFLLGDDVVTGVKGGKTSKL
ncbi:peroxisomal 2 4-dienoyl-CoA reductase sps19 [Lecanora helva]